MSIYFTNLVVFLVFAIAIAIVVVILKCFKAALYKDLDNSKILDDFKTKGIFKEAKELIVSNSELEALQKKLKSYKYLGFMFILILPCK